MSSGCKKCKCRCKRNISQTFEGDVRIRGNLIVEGTTTSLSNLIVHGRITDEQGQHPRLGPLPGELITTITQLGTYNRSQLSQAVVISVTPPFQELALVINFDISNAITLINRSSIAVPIVLPNFSTTLLPNFAVTYIPGPDPIISGPNPA